MSDQCRQKLMKKKLNFVDLGFENVALLRKIDKKEIVADEKIEVHQNIIDNRTLFTIITAAD